jgi:hypothetical protein
MPSFLVNLEVELEAADYSRAAELAAKMVAHGTPPATAWLVRGFAGAEREEPGAVVDLIEDGVGWVPVDLIPVGAERSCSNCGVGQFEVCGRPFFDADGSASVDLRCTTCNVQSSHSWTWGSEVSVPDVPVEADDTEPSARERPEQPVLGPLAQPGDWTLFGGKFEEVAHVEYEYYIRHADQPPWVRKRIISTTGKVRFFAHEQGGRYDGAELWGVAVSFEADAAHLGKEIKRW